MSHPWSFFRAGGFDQVRLDSGADLMALGELDQKLWVALTCPTKGLEFDARTLDLIDTDRDGRIRAPEIIAAVRWAGSLLKNAGDLTQRADSLPLSAINDQTAEGRHVLSSARHILASLGKMDATSISAGDTADTARIFLQTRFNGDGIVPAEAAEDAESRTVLDEIVACLGPETDRGGKPGVSQARVDRFFAELQSYSDWWSKAEAGRAAILPLGDATAEAGEAFRAVRAKVDDFFARCRLVAFDGRAAAAMNRQESDYAAMAAGSVAISDGNVAAFPLARVGSNAPLPLREGVNPAWSGAIARFNACAVRPLLGEKAALTEGEWSELCARLAPFEQWSASQPGAAVARLGLTRIRQILAGPAEANLRTLIAKDKALEPEFNAIATVDRLVRYYRDLDVLLNNFVSFRDFYTRRSKAIFQAGTLYMDGRSCELCVRVADPARHAPLAGSSRIYLAYCECTRSGNAEKMTVAAAFTEGDADFLMVGRNGIFYDRNGRDWDATVVKLVEHPISVRQAFWAPYKRIGKLIGDQIEKMAAAREKDVEQRAATTVAEAGARVEAARPAAALPPFDIAKFAGIFAAIGLALGAIGSAITGLVTGFLRLFWWQMPLAVLGILVVISGPSVVLAWLKLRQRNLGPLLEASGWAVNTRAMINIPFGSSLTAVAALPPGARRALQDLCRGKRS